MDESHFQWKQASGKPTKNATRSEGTPVVKCTTSPEESRMGCAGPTDRTIKLSWSIFSIPGRLSRPPTGPRLNLAQDQKTWEHIRLSVHVK